MKNDIEKTEYEKGVKCKEEKSEEIEYDHLLNAAGEFGRYQIFLFLSTFPFYVFGAFSYFSQIFITEVSPNHWCWIPELKNLSDFERRDLAIPSDVESRFGYSQCTSYVANWTDVLLTGQKPDKTWSILPCQSGWEFNKTEIPYPTISSEFGWVCDRSSYQAIAQSFFFVGSIIGGFLVGWIADRFGRLPAIVFSNMIGCVSGVASTYTYSFIQFTLCRFFMGMSYDNCMMMAYLLVLEYVAPKYRTLLANLPFAIFFTTGVCALPWIALACADWKIFSLATSIPLALSLLTPFVMPESPRWFLSKGRVDAIDKANNISRINKKIMPARLIEDFKSTIQNSNKKTSGSIMDMIKRPLLMRVFLCVCLEYLCCFLVFDSLIRTIGQLKYDFFLSFTVISFTEFPSLLIISFILDFTGRKCLMFVVLIVCGIFSFLTPFVGGGLPSVICAIMARFAVNMATNTTMQWAAEMIPASVRGSGTSIVHICGYIATVISPFVAYLEIYQPWLPLVIVGIVSIFAACLSLTMPETANKVMPQTFEDAEELIRNQKLWEVPCLNIKAYGGVKPNRAGHVDTSFEMN